MDISFKSKRFHGQKGIIIPVPANCVLGHNTGIIDKDNKNALSNNIAANPNFNGKAGDTAVIFLDERTHITLIGIGDPKNLDEKIAAKIGNSLQASLKGSKINGAELIGDDFPDMAMDSNTLYAHIANAVYESSYSFTKYKTDKSALPTKLETLNVVVDLYTKAEETFKHLSAVSKGKMWAQDLGNEPPNMLYPESYAKEIEDTLQPLGIKTRFIGEAEMELLGMGALLSVGASAANKPCIVVMEYDGSNGKTKRPVGLVGKGVTFDTGGYSLKSGASMPSMKTDMCGSAAVVGAIRALAEQGSSANIVAIVGLVENKIANDATVPDDIITSMSGKTIEIGNTDAEGRMVLADCMTLLQREYKPHTMIDLATLTGAVKASLGTTRAGFMTEDDKLHSQFNKAADKSGELIWRLPIDQNHKDAMKGVFADLGNMSNNPSVQGGASTAAGFLSNFVEGNTKWAHIDIAGTARQSKETTSGYGVKLLVQWINDNHSVKAPKIAASKAEPK